MAKANFEYEITSKDKSKAGTDTAEKNIKSVGEATKKVTSLMKAALAGISFTAIVKGIGFVNKAYEEQEKVEMRLASAAKNNPLLDSKSVTSLKNYAAGLQSVSTFGDEAIIQQQAFLATLNLSEEQIKNVLSASVDLASTGMLSLDSAVKNIAKTYGGMAGELGELIPSLRELTAEQLKGGEAVDLIAKQYAGMGEAIANTNSGIKTQIKNTFGDMAETVGAIFDGIGGDMLAGIQPHIEALGKWLSDNSGKIVAFFKNLPQIALASLVFVKDVFFSMFNWDFIKAIGGSIWEYFKVAAKTTILTVWSYIKAIGTTIWEPLKFGFETVVYGIKVAFYTVQDAIAGALNVIIDGLNIALNFAENKINKLIALQNKLTPGQKWDIGALNLGEVGRVTTSGGAGKAPENKLAETIGDAWKDFGGDVIDLYKTQWETLKETVGGIGDAFAENPAFQKAFSGFELTFSKLIEPTKKIVENTSDTTAEVQRQTMLIGRGAQEGQGSMRAGGIIPGRGRAFDSGIEGGGTEGSMLGAIIKLITGDIAEGLKMFAVALGESLKGVESVMMIMDSLATVIIKVVDIIGPAINTVLTPIIGILSVLGMAIGKILAPVIIALAPIIEKVGELFEWLYNEIIVPVGNFISTVFQTIAKTIIEVGNEFITLANKFRTKENQKALMPVPVINTSTLAKIKVEDVNTAGEEAIGRTTTGGGGGASYSSGRTINQTVIINTDVITGEGGGIRQLAIMIRDEIRSAEQLGA